MLKLTRMIFLVLLLLLLSVTSTLFAAEQPTLTWAYWEGAEPICWEENGVPKGLEVEIAEQVLKRLGIKVIHKFYPWARAQKMVETGEADMMTTTPNDARFKYAIFGKEMTLANFWTIYIKKGNVELKKKAESFTKLEDLKPYKLADFAGNGWQSAYMKAEDGYNIAVQVPSMKLVPQALVNDRVDMIINSENWVDWWADKLKITNQLEKINVELPNTRYHFVAMVSRKSPWASKGIIRAFDEELKNLKQSGEYTKILKKYRDPYGFGKAFKTQIDDSKYLTNYNSYPIYQP